MKAPNKSATLPQQRRARAEQRLRLTPRKVAQRPAGDVQTLVHELQVCQIAQETQIEELRRAQQELDQVRDHYAGLYNFAPIALLTLNADGTILEANFNASQLLELRRGSLIHQKFSRFVSADAQDAFYPFCRRVFRSKDFHSTILNLVTAQGNRLVVQVDAACDPKHPRKQCWFCCTDLTERKQAEEKLIQLDRAKAILGGIDRAIVHIGDQRKLLVEVCRVAVDEGGFKLAWVGMLSPDGSVQPVAKAGETGYLDGIRVWPTPGDPKYRGPVGLAIRENRMVVIGDLGKDASMAPWRDRALRFGLRYAAAFPIKIASKVTGAFVLYAPLPDFFDEQELV